MSIKIIQVATDAACSAYHQAMYDPTIPHVWRHVIDTVEPLIREQIAKEIETHPEHQYGQNSCCDFCDGLDVAIKIARGNQS